MAVSVTVIVAVTKVHHAVYEDMNARMTSDCNDTSNHVSVGLLAARAPKPLRQLQGYLFQPMYDLPLSYNIQTCVTERGSQACMDA